MGIYIHNMKMPKYTTKAEFGIDADGNPLCMVYHEDGTEPDIYDVVPLPEGHGRLTAEWISVKERLPEQNQRVLVCGVRGGVQICRYWENRDYGGGLQFMFFTNKQKSITVTHWMPLPEPPEEGGGGDGN